MIKKTALFVLCVMLLQNIATAKDTVKFTFPNEGWHSVVSPDGIKSKKCFVPANQTSENYTEMLTLIQKPSKVSDMSASAVLHRQLGKDRTNYRDIIPEYVLRDLNNGIVTWCSRNNNICAVERAFQGESGVILAIYTNRAPHYSQNMFGQWINNLGRLEVYNPQESNAEKNSSLIEL